MSGSTAKRIARSLNTLRPQQQPEAITDPAAQQILRAMQDRGILGDVPGLPQPAEKVAAESKAAQDARYDAVIAAMTPKPVSTPAKSAPAASTSAADILRAALSNANHSVTPLNGAGIIRAALAQMEEGRAG
jgi:hypothetical protein